MTEPMQHSEVPAELAPAHPTQPPARLPLELLVVAAGGVLGALTRHACSQLLPSAGAEFPAATFAVNLAGCLALGVWLGLLERRLAHPLLRPFIVVGLFGSLTTFSTFAVETWQLIDADRAVLAFGYVGGSVVFGVLAFALGNRLGRALQ